LERIAQIHNYNKIATAHIINDNTETVLLNLIKGTGLKGISGIPVSRGKIIRPLLGISKDEIISYLKLNKILFRIDESNLDDKYERNFIRNDLIPRIKNKLNPNLDSTVFRSSQLFRNYSGFIEEQILKFDKYCVIESGVLSIKISDLKKIDEKLKGDFFIYHIQKHFDIQLNFTDIIAIQKLADGEASKKVILAEHLTVTHDRDKIVFNIAENETEFSSEIEIKVNQLKKINGNIIQVNAVKKFPKSFSSTGDIEYIEAGDLDEEFYIRKWKTGDKFIPFGMSGTKNISDYLNALKIPASEKKNKLVLINRNRIVWVVGYRIDDRFRITGKTKKVIRLCLK
jgi:tRNA(Ile)-lysidine synthase